MTARRNISAWRFPELSTLPSGESLIAVGADLEPVTLLDAYESGYFPMPLGGRKLGWFSPDPRGILWPSDLKVSKSLRRSARRYRCTINHSFDSVIRACGDPSRPQGWINRPIVEAYTRLHRSGDAHSIEVWERDELVGGLYGVNVGGLFAGESMFHRETDASKVALMHLVDTLGEESGRLIDVQWNTPHLASLGAREVSRHDYDKILKLALLLPRAHALAV